MGMLLGCGEGLLEMARGWKPRSCPLKRPDLLALDQGRMAAVDNANRLMWLNGQLFPCDPGVEALCLWQSYALALSGDTDCLLLLDAASGLRLVSTRAGVYPQDARVLPGLGMVAVCGGAEGTIRLLSLPELHTLRVIPVPGSAQRLDTVGGVLHVLCATEDAGLKCLLCRVLLQSGACQPVAVLPGLPGAIRADRSGGLWVGASEYLYHLPFNCDTPDHVYGGFGLIRHLDCWGQWVLATDPVMGLCALVDGGAHKARVIYHGDVGQALFT